WAGNAITTANSIPTSTAMMRALIMSSSLSPRRASGQGALGGPLGRKARGRQCQRQYQASLNLRWLVPPTAPPGVLRLLPEARRVVRGRGFSVRPVAQAAAIARDPVDPPAASAAIQHDRDELVLDGMLGLQELGVHEPRRRRDAGLAVEAP